MALTDLEIATRVRNLISERSPGAVNVTIPHIRGLISTGMELWGRLILNDPEKSRMLMKSFSIPLVSGVLDLTPYVNGVSGKISLRELRASTIYTTVSAVRTAFTWMSSMAMMTNARLLSTDQPAILLDGNTLRTKNIDGSLTSLGTASVEFNVVNVPSSATDLPPALLGDFIVFLADLASREKVVDGR